MNRVSVGKENNNRKPLYTHDVLVIANPTVIVVVKQIPHNVVRYARKNCFVAKLKILTLNVTIIPLIKY